MKRVEFLRRSGFWAVSATLLLGLALTFPRPQVASAHPLGNFTINHYSRIEFTGGQVYLRYISDLAEIPTFQEMAAIDLDRDGQVSDGERADYLQRKVEEIRRGLQLSLNGSPRELQAIDQELSFPPGQGGLPTLRLSILLQGPQLQRTATPQTLYYRDDNYDQRLGWREIVAQADESTSLRQSNVPQRDQSDELRAYPQDMLSSPLNLREAHVTFVIVSGQGGVGASFQSASATATESRLARGKDALASLITAQQLSLPVVILALLTALGLGAVHALTPGHGKTIMAAYLVGTRGRAIHALFLGLTVTISHTLGVLALGLVTLYASHLIAPERLYPWLGLASGAIVAAIGVRLLVTRLRSHQGISPQRAEAGRGQGDSHPHHHNHDHDHPHTHTPGGNGQWSITWRNLAALGVAGGLVPSVSALVILLAAISMQRIGFGLFLILAFSAGMAGVLAGIGLLLVYAGRLLERFRLEHRPVRALARLLPLTTALVVLVSGLVIATRAIFQVGLL